MSTRVLKVVTPSRAVRKQKGLSAALPNSVETGMRQHLPGRNHYQKFIREHGDAKLADKFLSQSRSRKKGADGAAILDAWKKGQRP